MPDPLLTTRVRGSRVHQLRWQQLEARLAMSVSPVSVEEITLRLDTSHLDHMSAMILDDGVWVVAGDESGDATDEVFLGDEDPNPNEDQNDQTALPAIPFDDSFSPVSECPDLEDDFCLPDDTSQDGTFDFHDFLLLNENYGLENATREDGDLNGDGRVGFEDLLLLSANFSV